MRERPRILVIDDSTTLRKLVEIAFRGTAAEVDFASSGMEAVRRALAHPPDVVLLDYMLPDMGGVDVCARFAEHASTAAVPVVVMSGKREGVREAFHAFPFVVDFVAKPFAMEEIRARLGAAMLAPPPPRLSASSAPAGSSGAISTLPPASTLPPLSTLPPISSAPVSTLPAGSSGSIAVPVLGPASGPLSGPGSGAFAVPRAIGESGPVSGAFSGARSGAQLSGAAVAAEVTFTGDLAVMSLLDALRFVASLRLTGCLTLELATRIELYTRDGDVVLCASYSPAAAADLDHVDLARAPRAAIERASADQARTGKPAVAALAEAGYVPREVAPIAIRDQGARILAAALEARAGQVAWRSLPALPDHVTAFGRPQALAGIALEQRRGARASEEVPVAFLSAVFQRTPRFSRKLAGARLSSTERKLLSLFDGETTLAAILDRTGISADKAVSVCNRLAAVDLIELREQAGAGAGGFSRIALWDAGGGDLELERALHAVLQRRVPPIELVELCREPDLVAAILRSRPRLILVTHPASAQLDLIAELARSTASALIAVLDLATPSVVDGCLVAGFHAVLVKPIHINDLERLLAS